MNGNEVSHYFKSIQVVVERRVSRKKCRLCAICVARVGWLMTKTWCKPFTTTTFRVLVLVEGIHRATASSAVTHVALLHQRKDQVTEEEEATESAREGGVSGGRTTGLQEHATWCFACQARQRGKVFFFFFLDVFCRTFVLNSFVAACDCFAFVEDTKKLTETCVLRCGVPRSSVRAFVGSMWHVLVFIVAVPRFPLAFQAMGCPEDAGFASIWERYYQQELDNLWKLVLVKDIKCKK